MSTNRFRLPYADWGSAEFDAALRAFVGGRIRHGPAAEALEEQFARLLGGAHAFAVNSGRTALKAGLNGLSTLSPERTQVIVPAYICPAVVSAVRQAGLTPVAAPIGPDLNIDARGVPPLIGKKTLAIVVAHMYGCPADIGGLERLARRYGVFLVDDAAQVVGESVDGRALGTFGDFGIVSFAQSKCVVSGESGAGGVLICQNPQLLPIVRTAITALEPASSRGSAFLAFVWSYLLGPLPDRLAYYWRHFVPAKPREITPARIANLDARIAICQLESYIDRRSKRVSILDCYSQQLSGNELGIGFPQYAPDRYLARAMLLLPESYDASLCRKELNSRSVTTRGAYQVLLDSPESVRVAKAMAKRLIEVPTATSMSARDVKYVCNRLLETLALLK